MESPFSKLAFNSARPWREKRNSLEVPPNSFFVYNRDYGNRQDRYFQGETNQANNFQQRVVVFGCGCGGSANGQFESNDYWYRMKVRVKIEDGIELSTICRQLKLDASDGKIRN